MACYHQLGIGLPCLKAPPGTRDHSRLPMVLRQLDPTAFLATTAAMSRPSCVGRTCKATGMTASWQQEGIMLSKWSQTPRSPLHQARSPCHMDSLACAPQRLHPTTHLWHRRHLGHHLEQAANEARRGVSLPVPQLPLSGAARGIVEAQGCLQCAIHRFHRDGRRRRGCRRLRLHPAQRWGIWQPAKLSCPYLQLHMQQHSKQRRGRHVPGWYASLKLGGRGRWRREARRRRALLLTCELEVRI